MPVGAHIRVTSSGIDQVVGGFERTGKAIKTVGGNALVATEKLQRMVGGVTSQLRGLPGLLGGLGAAGAGKKVLEFRSALGQLQVEARLSTAEMRKIEAQVLKAADGGGVMASELVGALKVFQGYGGILEFGRDMMEDMVRLTKATGAPMQELATIASALHKTLGLGKDEVIEAFAAMKSMSIAGTLTMQQTAPDLPQLLGMGKGFGFRGLRGVRQLGSAQQVIGELLPSSAESKTALQGLFRNLVAQSKKLKGMGVEVFNSDSTMKDIDAVMLQVLQGTGGVIQGPKGLSSIFNDEGLKAALAFSSSYDRQLKAWRSGSNVESIFGAGSTAKGSDIAADAALRTGGIAAESERVNKALAKLEAGLFKHGGSIVEWLAEDPMRIAMIAGGGLLAAKGLFPAVKGGLAMRKGWAGLLGSGVGDVVSGGGALGGGTPVSVTNWPSGLGGGGGGGVNSLGGASKRAATKLEKLGAAFEVAKGAVSAFAVGFGIGTAVDEYFNISDEISRSIEEIVDPVRVAKRRAAVAATWWHGENEKDADQFATSRRNQVASDLAGEARQWAGRGAKRKGARGTRTLGIAAEVMEKHARERGLSDSEVALLMPVLLRIAAGVEKPMKAQVSAPGLDRPVVELSRGGVRR